ncbi:MAG: hypothetical protein A2W25_16280 [candidate division Zixibacteria bacterium RBG_16_53_22]|nr:MAG: hypothetical protein A2W25_16280 [candidate division Zixibacteria bacterium RBG_16_53_22]
MIRYESYDTYRLVIFAAYQVCIAINIQEDKTKKVGSQNQEVENKAAAPLGKSQSNKLILGFNL